MVWFVINFGINLLLTCFYFNFRFSCFSTSSLFFADISFRSPFSALEWLCAVLIELRLKIDMENRIHNSTPSEDSWAYDCCVSVLRYDVRAQRQVNYFHQANYRRAYFFQPTTKTENRLKYTIQNGKVMSTVGRDIVLIVMDMQAWTN